MASVIGGISKSVDALLVAIGLLALLVAFNKRFPLSPEASGTIAGFAVVFLLVGVMHPVAVLEMAKRVRTITSQPFTVAAANVSQLIVIESRPVARTERVLGQTVTIPVSKRTRAKLTLDQARRVDLLLKNEGARVALLPAPEQTD